MSETMLDNPAIMGERDESGDAYVFYVRDGFNERAVCHHCALAAYVAGETVTLGGAVSFDDPFAPFACEDCDRPIDGQYRAALDECDWLNALQDALDHMSREG